MKTNTPSQPSSKILTPHCRAIQARMPFCLMATVSVLIGISGLRAHAETWVLPAGGSWNAGASWDTTLVPNAIGATAILNTPTANRTITNDGGTIGITIGSLIYDNSATFTTSLTTGTANSKLILNNGGAGASIVTSGIGTGNLTISVPTVLSDLVTAQVDQLATSSQAGSLNLTAAISGTGGLIKQGDGLMTFGTGAKTYTGPTVLSGGRTRISLIARPTATSVFTINNGAQLTLIAAGTFNFGSGPLNLNGDGAASGPFAAFRGAIRNDTNLAVTITNSVALQSNTLLHVQGSATGSITFTNTISGVGSLTLTAPDSDTNLGKLVLTGNNSYSGGTVVNGGILDVNSDAALGALAGDVVLNSHVDSKTFLTLPVTLRATGLLSTTERRLILANFGGTIDTTDQEVTYGVGSTVTGTALVKIGSGKMTIAGTQTYDTLTTIEGRTDIASALTGGSGLATINAGAVVNISTSQTLAAFNITDGALVTLASPPPPAPSLAEATPDFGGESVGNSAQAVPEPGSAVLVLGGLGVLFGLRRRESV